MLSDNELLNLIYRAKQGDNDAKEEIIGNNSPLIKSIVRKFIGKGIEYDDLYQIACIGFLKAINNFDESFNVKLSTYSVPMIIGEIKRYIRDNGALKVSRAIKILANKINRFVDVYMVSHNTSPTIEFLANKFNVSQEDIIFALDSAKMPLSIFDKFEDEEDSQELCDKIPDKKNEDDLVDKIHLSNIIEHLPEKERKIITMRYFRDYTQTEIAIELGVSQVQVSRLENKILNKIKEKY